MSLPNLTEYPPPSISIFEYIFRFFKLGLIVGILIGIIAIIPSIIVDLIRKKFHFSKWVIICLAGLVILFFLFNFVANLFGINTTGLVHPTLK